MAFPRLNAVAFWMISTGWFFADIASLLSLPVRPSPVGRPIPAQPHQLPLRPKWFGS